MKKQLTIIAAAATVLAGWALAGDVAEVSASSSEKLGKYEATGQTVECLSTRKITSIEPVSESTLLVKAGSDMYVNNVSGECHGATRGDTWLQFTTTNPQLCKTDIIIVVDNRLGTPTGSCGLGSFEKLAEKAPA